jgi:hypothetical protein
MTKSDKTVVENFQLGQMDTCLEMASKRVHGLEECLATPFVSVERLVAGKGEIK